MFALLREFQASAGVAPNFLVYPDANNAGCTYHTANGGIYQAPTDTCPKPVNEECFSSDPVGHTVWIGEHSTRRYKICGMENWKKKGTW